MANAKPTTKTKAKADETEDLEMKLKKEIEKSYEDKIKELEMKLKEVEESNEVQKSNVGYKFIPDETKVRIKSNTGGIFTFNEDRGKTRVFFQMDNYGETAVVSYDELRIFNSSKPSFIKKGIIAIIDVYSDCGVTLEDVVNDLKLDKIYLDDSRFNPIELEEMFDDKLVSENEFSDRLFKSADQIESIVEVAYKLYKTGRFSNYTKMNAIRQLTGNPNLFK